MYMSHFVSPHIPHVSGTTIAAGAVLAAGSKGNIVDAGVKLGIIYLLVHFVLVPLALILAAPVVLIGLATHGSALGIMAIAVYLLPACWILWKVFLAIARVGDKKPEVAPTVVYRRAMVSVRDARSNTKYIYQDELFLADHRRTQVPLIDYPSDWISRAR